MIMIWNSLELERGKGMEDAGSHATGRGKKMKLTLWEEGGGRWEWGELSQTGVSDTKKQTNKQKVTACT